jgi:hypothetical protein
VSCNSNNNLSTESKDSLQGVDNTIIKINTTSLDDLLKIKNEEELKKIFGAENVTHDTVWGAEGMFFIGTKLFGRTPDEVVFNWTDTLNNANLYSVSIECYYDRITGKTSFGKRWKTKAGIMLGTSLKELNTMNGKEFSFSGLGWDYGGNVSSWNDGKLEKSGIAVTLDVSADEIMPAEYDKIVGDVLISSNDPNALIVNPVVRELFLLKQ